MPYRHHVICDHVSSIPEKDGSGFAFTGQLSDYAKSESVPRLSTYLPLYEFLLPHGGRTLP